MTNHVLGRPDCESCPVHHVRAMGRLARLVVATSILVAGLVAGALSPGGVPTAEAACQSAHAACQWQDATRTAILSVKNCMDTGSGTCGDPVAPNTTHVCVATVQWSSALRAFDPTCSCLDHQEQATLQVTWTGTAWSISCTARLRRSQPDHCRVHV